MQVRIVFCVLTLLDAAINSEFSMKGVEMSAIRKMGRERFSYVLTALATLVVFAAASAFAEDRFTDNGDETVTDQKTGLMWAQMDNQGDINWHQARRWVKYTFPDTLPASYENWRMPTLEELKSLYVKKAGYKGYETDCGLTVRIAPVIRLSCALVWASEEVTITARLFNFQLGSHYTDRMAKNRGHRVLAVRNIE